ncbi:LysR family transcriptional regulator [Klebsiella pneumoniae]|uniref:LysR family transcriptional regulator n=1 Tax=Klebsiella pneumoniae TaxID=573 RepID=UPI001D775446|nr:LysR family transcriptional regulator [Klebsiella pneumoniae]EHQ8971778.1 LysR family transcriptional regulator [Escherichia coli]MDP0615529.1 LysR family transcriptional regulator [Klebsiella pneumoniae]
MNELRPEIYWTHLYWLTVLEEQKSYTRAAEKLAVSKSAISQKISELERVTGKMLVHRTTRSVTLSEDGLRLVAELNGPFGQIRDIFTGTCDEGGPLRGTLRLTAPVAFSRQQLVPAITPFLHQHPQLQLQLEVTDRLVSLAMERVDLAIRHCRREALPETHVAWPLCQTVTLVVASSEYIRRAGRPDSPEDLRHHQCLTYPRGSQIPMWSFESIDERRERINVHVHGPFATNNSESLRDAVLSGLGIALLPDFSAREAIESGQAQELLAGWRPVDVFAESLYVIRPYTPRVSRAVETFSRYLKDIFS